MEKKKWGGARKGAGRKPIVKDGVHMTITLTPEDREKLKALGGSRWVAGMLNCFNDADNFSTPAAIVWHKPHLIEEDGKSYWTNLPIFEDNPDPDGEVLVALKNGVIMTDQFASWDEPSGFCSFDIEKVAAWAYYPKAPVFKTRSRKE